MYTWRNKEIFKFRIDDVNYYVDKSNCIREEDGTKVEWYIDDEWLNMNAEIIEEDKKIEYPILHKTAPSETTGDQMPNWRNLIDCNFEHLNKTIYQLIDEINNLKENKQWKYEVI